MNAFLFFYLHAINGVCAMYAGSPMETDSEGFYDFWIGMRPTSFEIDIYIRYWYGIIHGKHLPRHEELRDQMKKLQREVKSQNGYFQLNVNHPNNTLVEYTTRWNDIKKDLLPKLIQQVGDGTPDARIIKSTFPRTNPIRSFMFDSSREDRVNNLKQWLKLILNGISEEGEEWPTPEVKTVIRREFFAFCQKIRDRYSRFQLEDFNYPRLQFFEPDELESMRTHGGPSTVYNGNFEEYL